MAKVTFILGLAGSGKTHLVKQITATTGAKAFDGVVHNKLLPTIIQRLRDGKDCIVEEIAYCYAPNRDRMETELRSQVPDVKIEWICFENDLENANWNVTHRTNKRDVAGHLAINRDWHRVYTCPDGAKMIAITRIDQGKSTA